jgi:glycosyltransferase involved in cell wall biosynthesis
MIHKLRIGISLGHVKTWHDGLGEFSWQLSQGLAQRAPEWRERYGVEILFHLPKKFHGFAGPEVAYLPTHDIQRVFHWSKQPFSIWHSVHQHIKFQPPLGTPHRLLSVHDMNFLYEETPTPSVTQRRLRRLWNIVRRNEHLIVHTDYVRQDLLFHLPCPSTPEVIPLGVTDLSTSPQEPVGPVQGKAFFFHLSRLAPSKGIFYLIELARLSTQDHFVFAGPASVYSEKVAARVRSLGLRNVTLLTNISEAQKAWLYQHCKAFLFPSLTEGFGLPPLEAMCFGKPVFLSNRTCLPEIGGEFAHYWSELEPLSMKNQLDRALAHSSMSPSHIQAHGRSFTWARCAELYAQRYLQVLGIKNGL